MTNNTLLLQGPMGPFFKRLSRDLDEAGCNVFKINFNAADSFYFKGENTTEYRDTLEHWPKYFRRYIKQNKINTIYLFGDARHYHKIAHRIANSLSIDVLVFEEGYLRPHYITLEKGGVNGHSSIPNTPEAYENIEINPERNLQHVPYTFFHTAWYAIIYFTIGWLGRKNFPHYIHHRPFKPHREALIWLRSAYRKFIYKFKEHGIIERLTTDHSKKFFLVPLQVHNDAQVKVWSPVSSTALFIKKAITSFARNAPTDNILVIKHHPLDRGYIDYTKIITRLAKNLNCRDRILYIHDLHLPTLLDHAKGTVLINSTVGLSSILHNTPVKAIGKAIYDIDGLTFQGKLKKFWKAPGKVNKKLNLQLRAHVIKNTQVNGNFYRKTQGFECHTGIDFAHLTEDILTPSKKARNIPITQHSKNQNKQKKLTQPVTTELVSNGQPVTTELVSNG